jgi:hypothetical protein
MTDLYDNPWIYCEKPFTSEEINDYLGFVYEIFDHITNKKYIGKKLFFSSKKLAPLKGQKRKRKKILESDWKAYYGSSEEIKTIVEEHGSSRFSRKILHLCKSKGEMSYLELKEQVISDALLKPDEYYNQFVGGKIHRNHVKGLHLTKNDL